MIEAPGRHHDPSEDHMPIERVNGVQIHYEVYGQGEPLLFVHGYTGDVSDWRFQIPEFERTHRVLVMDHRGHGQSEAPADRGAYSILEMADDVEAVAAHAGFERYHLLGHSMGGAVAQEIALRSPGRLLSLTLEDTGHNFHLSRNETVAKFIAARNKIAEEQGMAGIAAMPALAPPAPHMPPERREEETARLKRMSVDAYIGAWQGLEAWQGTTERAASISVPTLVIYGDLDQMLIDAAKHLASTIPNADLVAISEAAHSPQYERPELFNAALRRHLARNATAAAK
jgi:3-oxoadipate enol-lactonase